MDRRLLAAAALALLLPACGSDDPGPTASGTPGPTTSATSQPPTTTLTPSPAFTGKLIRVFVAGGKVTNEVAKRQDVRRGESVRIEVTSDRPNELHVHGYDLKVRLQPNVMASLVFDADNPGSFHVELENPRLELFELRVR